MTFVSFAQNLEDVVLWRALRHIERGNYVDVGAAHPIVESVSAAFFEREWSGVHIEPDPTCAALLRKARPNDHVIEAAAGAAEGTSVLRVVPETGLSSLDDGVKNQLEAGERPFHDIQVSVRTIDAMLTELGLEGRPIHFMKVDVEGHEFMALQGADLRKWKPWVLVIEATAPESTRQTHHEWEPAVIDAGYNFCLFDGLNRFYVHEAHTELNESLSYPTCVLDEPFIRWRDQQNIAQQARTRLNVRLAEMTQQSANLDAELAAMTNTLSWRVTRPLRFVRGARTKRTSRQLATENSDQARKADEQLGSGTPVDPAAAREAFETRLGQVVELLDGSNSDLPDRLAAFERALSKTTEPPIKVAWLGYVAATGRYPDDSVLAACARGIDQAHPRAFVRRLEDLFEHAFETESVSLTKLDVVRDCVLVDVTHTAQHDLHTGIQRVVREVGERWLGLPAVIGVWWDDSRGGLRRLGAHELTRFRDWRSHLPHEAGSEASGRLLIDCPDEIVVPWGCTMVLPELVGEPERTAGYRTLACAGISTGISMIGYDLIPITAAETVREGMPGYFGCYLSLVKHTKAISTISETTAADFRAFVSTLASQGLSGPNVHTHLLPASPQPSCQADIEQVRNTYRVGTTPLVLVVGSHEPRKNHLVILEAAERLWNKGIDFTLAFIGGSGWKGEAFNREIDRLQSMRLPLITRRRASEAELWAAYRLARFTVFPSLVEGFGLPIVESMACGTPVITSNYGAMAEVAVGGGALMIDPRNVDELTDAMRRLLEDDDLVAKLGGEAAQREWSDWSDYADQVWQFLVPTESQ